MTTILISIRYLLDNRRYVEHKLKFIDTAQVHTYGQ